MEWVIKGAWNGTKAEWLLSWKLCVFLLLQNMTLRLVVYVTLIWTKLIAQFFVRDNNCNVK